MDLFHITQKCRTVPVEDATAAVEQNIEETPFESIRPQQSELCPCYLWKILRGNLDLRAFKIQLVQILKPNDLHAGHMFDE